MNIAIRTQRVLIATWRSGAGRRGYILVRANKGAGHRLFISTATRDRLVTCRRTQSRSPRCSCPLAFLLSRLVQRQPRAPEQRSVARVRARITGPIRRRSTSQRRVPGSQTPPARWDVGTMHPNSANSTGPMRAGRGGGGRTPDPGRRRRAGTIVRAASDRRAGTGCPDPLTLKGRRGAASGAGFCIHGAGDAAGPPPQPPHRPAGDHHMRR